VTPILLFATALGVAAPALKEKPKPELDVVGEWQVESITTNGRKSTTAPNLVYSFTKEGKWLILRDGEETKTTLDRRFEFDAKAAKPTMDLITSAVNPNTRLRGIFKIEGDTLTICGIRATAGPGEQAPRPTTFESAEGSGASLYVLKRVKK
jgi:uncharacterized protein (TIGR03067 family)